MEMTKNLNFLGFVLENRGGGTITEIVKLSYLIDLASLKKFGKKISDFIYIRYFYGPYNKEIQTSLEKLAENKIVNIEAKVNSNGYDNIVYSINSVGLNSSLLSEDEKSFIIDVLEDLAPYRATALTDIAYKTEPMIKLGATLGGNEHLNEILI